MTPARGGLEIGRGPQVDRPPVVASSLVKENHGGKALLSATPLSGDVRGDPADGRAPSTRGGRTELTGKRDPRDRSGIDLMPAARAILLEKRLEVGEGLLFRNQLGGPRNHADVQRAFGKAVKRAGLSSAEGAVTFHTLRHTAASRLANDPRVGPVFARDFLGHSSLQITNQYIHKVEDAARTSAAAQALAGLL